MSHFDITATRDAGANETLDVLGPRIRFLTALSRKDDEYCLIAGAVPAGVVVPIARLRRKRKPSSQSGSTIPTLGQSRKRAATNPALHVDQHVRADGLASVAMEIIFKQSLKDIPVLPG
jgi:hypothetical protein